MPSAVIGQPAIRVTMPIKMKTGTETHAVASASSPASGERTSSAIPAANDCCLALLEIGSNGRAHPNESERYFAKPGEAEWGC